jgi:hypothetical protein
MTSPGSTDPASATRSFTVTAQLTVRSTADLRDPLIRFAVFQALVGQLTTAQLRLDTPHGPAIAEFGLVTGWS